MNRIVTLIGPPGQLDQAAINRACAALPDAGAVQWLDAATAADIPFTATADTDQRAAAAVKTALAGPFDIAVQPQAGRRKKLFLADMDSTMIGQECIDELADYAGLKPHIAAITERAMRGEIAFTPALRERVALLKGLPISVVNEVIEKRITLTSGARTLVATMRANGAYTCLVSGGFTLFTTIIAAMIGFDEARANTLVLDGDKLAGAVAEPVFGREAKHAALLEMRELRQLAPQETLAVGDGANDLDMIVEAGLGVAYHAKPKVADAAAARVDHGDLTALLYMQGFRRDEFVEA
jgi:phosphoserine phosphatase